MSELTRSDLDALPKYVAGRSVPGAIKLASNEVPFGPLPGVTEAIVQAASETHRYPDMGVLALREALAEWPIYGGGKLCLEYVLIPGVNDAPHHARQLAGFIDPINQRYRQKTGGTSARCLLNLIPYNPRRNSPWPAPAEEDVDRFLGWLLDAGLYAKRRRTKGRQMMGACGQLGSESIRKRQLVVLNQAQV